MSIHQIQAKKTKEPNMWKKKKTKWDSIKLMRNKNLDSYTVFEAPRPRISLYCKKTKGNPKIKLTIHFTEETHAQRERERDVLCHIFQLDQPQQTQSNQVVPDVKDHSFSETFKNLFLLSLSSFVMICISPYGSFFLSS